MARKPSSGLFDLIHALNSNEKRYITLTGQLHFKGRSNKHFQLFVLIQKMSELDDERLKKQLYPDGGTSGYAELKRYLYQFILKALVSYDESNSSLFRLRTGLLKMRSLYKRGLLKNCQEILRPLQRLAKDTDDIQSDIELQEWEQKLAFARNDIAYFETRQEENEELHAQYMQQLKNTFRLDAIRYTLFKFRLTYSNRIDGQAKERVNDILESLPDFTNAPKSYTEQKKLLNILSYECLLTNAHEQYYEHTKKLFELIKTNQADYFEYPGETIFIIDKLILGCNTLGRYGEAKSLLNELLMISKYKAISSYDRKTGICIYYINLLIQQSLRGDFDAAVVTVEEFRKTYSPVYYQEYAMNFNYLFLYIFFARKSYTDALGIIEEITTSTGKERQDIKSLARCLEIVIHYELGNHLFIESLVRSARRYLKKDFEELTFEAHLIQLIRKLLLLKYDQKKLFTDFKELLSINYSSPDQRNNITIDIVATWVASNINGLSFGKLINERFLKNRID